MKKMTYEEAMKIVKEKNGKVYNIFIVLYTLYVALTVLFCTGVLDKNINRIKSTYAAIKLFFKRAAESFKRILIRV